MDRNKQVVEIEGGLTKDGQSDFLPKINNGWILHTKTWLQRTCSFMTSIF